MKMKVAVKSSADLKMKSENNFIILYSMDLCVSLMFNKVVECNKIT